jgi:hypothetical protein
LFFCFLFLFFCFLFFVFCFFCFRLFLCFFLPFCVCGAGPFFDAYRTILTMDFAVRDLSQTEKGVEYSILSQLFGMLWRSQKTDVKKHICVTHTPFSFLSLPPPYPILSYHFIASARKKYARRSKALSQFHFTSDCDPPPPPHPPSLAPPSLPTFTFNSTYSLTDSLLLSKVELSSGGHIVHNRSFTHL